MGILELIYFVGQVCPYLFGLQHHCDVTRHGLPGLSATVVQVPGERSGSALAKGQLASLQESLVSTLILQKKSSEQSVLRQTFLWIAWIYTVPFLLL